MMNLCDEYDIIIEGGQSNAEGSGIGPVCKFEEFTPSPRILYLTPDRKVIVDDKGVHVEYPSNDLKIEIAEERVVDGKLYGDLALTFAEDYIKNGRLKGDRKLLIVRGAVGGTSFHGADHWGVNKGLHSKMVEMVDYALSLNPQNKVVAFLWHQGEGDTNHATAEEYRRYLDDMIIDIRKRYGDMPFVAGNFVQEWIPIRGESCNELADAYRKFASENKKAAFVETDGLLSNNQKNNNGDQIHFCREALYELGHRYYDAFSEIV